MVQLLNEPLQSQLLLESGASFWSDRRLRYSGLSVFLLVAIVTIMAGADLVQFHRQAEINVATTTQNLAKSLDQTFTSLIDSIDVALMASATEIGRQVSANSVDQHSITALLMDRQHRIPTVDHFRATNEQGDIIYGTDVHGQPVNTSDRRHFIRLRDEPDLGLVTTKPYVGRISHKWVWIFARRISKTDGSFAGIVFAAVSVDEIENLFARIEMDPDSTITLRDADMELVARYSAAHRMDTPIGEQRFSAPFLAALKANPREGTYSSGTGTLDGVDRTFSYHQNAKYGFLVNVGIANQRAFAGWRRQAWITGGLVLAFTLALFAFLILINRAWRRQDLFARSLQAAHHIARLGHYSIDVRTGTWRSSGIFNAIVGIDNSYPRDARHWQDLAAPEHRAQRQADMESAIAQRLPFDREYRIVRPRDGIECWVHSQAQLQLDTHGVPFAFVGTLLDITKRRESEADLRIAAVAFDSQEAMVITNSEGTILRVNRAFTVSTGYAFDEVIGQNPRILKSHRHDRAFFVAMWDTIMRTGGWQGEIWDRGKNGKEYQKWLTISTVKNPDGEVTHYVGAQFDITNRKEAEERIKTLAFYDQLTGLANRTLLLDRLRQTMTGSLRSGRYGALLLIDLDHFKTLNDTLGHDMGDLLLKQVAERLTACVRSADTVARFGGDEFVVILADLSSDQTESATQTELVGEKLIAALNKAYRLREITHHSTPSIGASLFNGHQTDVDALLKQADLAMYRAKAEGRNGLRFFDPDMEIVVAKRAALESDLREAVEEQQFVVHYQPQVDDGHVTGVEALIRWQHPHRGLVSPAEFIPLSEETGLILPLGQWVLEMACKQLAAWANRPAWAHLVIAVNVSAHQFRQADFVTKVLAALRDTGANPRRLNLELTESLLVENVSGVIEKMITLKACGIGFSLDDFGTGYSSLSYLKRLPLDHLKIDQSFVRDVLIDPNDAVIARSVIALAHSLGLGVIAEGVETDAQRTFLEQAGCHAYQGYLCSRPLSLQDLEPFLESLSEQPRPADVEVDL